MAAAKKINKPEEVRVSFLPEEKSFLAANVVLRRQLIFLGAVVAIVVTVIGGTGYFGFQARAHQELTAQLKSDTESLASQRSTLESQIGNLGNLSRVASLAGTSLRSRNAWEKVPALLEATVIPDVALSHIAVDGKGTIVLSATAASYGAVARQVLVWQESEGITAVDISGVQLMLNAKNESEGVNFDATLTLDPKALKWNPL